MKPIFLSFLIPFIVHCSGTAKKSSVEQMNRQVTSQGIIDQARYLSQEVLAEGKENVDFLLKKLKTATRKYKDMQKRIVLLENRVQQLVRQIQNREDVEITVEEEGETALMEEVPDLFDEDEEVDNPFLSQKTEKLPVPQNAEKKSKKDQEVSEDTKGKKETASSKKLFISGQKLFIEQSWEKAIEVLEEYRNKHPEGTQYPSATYLIGRAFQELNMKEEAQIFFKELVAGYPNSPFAKKAQKLIK
ncbi:MAG: tetratricopeptide repeat protein [Bdellovibrionales bacterium]|nr:tetratricopeptide repeat protein [Bdellovibrionales bacterium]